MRFTANHIAGQRGFTRIELFVVVSSVVVLFLVVSPMLAKRYAKAGRIKCSDNLKQIALAFKMYAGDNDGKFPWIPKSSGTDFTNQLQAWQYFQAVSNYISSPKLLLCPRDKKASASDYSGSKDGLAHPSKQNNSISYFLGIYSSDSSHKSILVGDRTLTAPSMSKLYTSKGTNAVEVTTDSIWSSAPLEANHEDIGNFALADGRVQQSKNITLQSALSLARKLYGTNATRFLFPQ